MEANVNRSIKTLNLHVFNDDHASINKYFNRYNRNVNYYVTYRLTIRIVAFCTYGLRMILSVNRNYFLKQN
jgi:hypothetical protein